VLLLHGFPTSSHMFHNLLPRLADKYHVVAPDYGDLIAGYINNFLKQVKRMRVAQASGK